jgi:hypothetical protein
MKSLGSCSIFLLCMLILAPTPTIRADNSEPFVSGSVTLSFADGATMHVEFRAKLHEDGRTSGEMTLSGPKETLNQNVDGTNQDDEETVEKRIEASAEFYFKAAFDCMVVKGTEAVMSGTVNESNSKRYVGQRVLLVVQDRGDGLKSTSADRLTWGLYNSKPRTWVASDAEVENDAGIGASWIATDSERDDDAGIVSDKVESIGCQSFPLSAFSLHKIRNGEGNIEVRP